MRDQWMAAMVAGWLIACGPAWGGQEEELIGKTIYSAAKAAATFSDTRDKQSVLNLYTGDYMGIQDGETETRETIEQWLSEYESELKKGSTLRFVGSVSNVHIQVTGSTAWVTYDYVFQGVRKGELEAQDTGKCTSLLRKESCTWLIFHEHCSKIRPSQGTG